MNNYSLFCGNIWSLVYFGNRVKFLCLVNYCRSFIDTDTLMGECSLGGARQMSWVQVISIALMMSSRLDGCVLKCNSSCVGFDFLRSLNFSVGTHCAVRYGISVDVSVLEFCNASVGCCGCVWSRVQSWLC